MYNSRRGDINNWL